MNLSSVFCLPPHPTDHIALIIELLGKVPRKLFVAGKYSKDFFTKKGNERLGFLILKPPKRASAALANLD